ncbi:hypothetical protein E2562_012510 [Oryza meyeriana var. granulata]|uniref:Uncharacterized protein n=1 Tax=Oryza meyeriana var. granulata TaxID=110450 RepID=A0A6G1BVL7_9ORYZ|nr:hypothetical protein E2562_012510 [Oryza meyeriana var. granulata]
MGKKEDHHVIDIPSLAQELRVQLASLKSSTERVGGGAVQPCIVVDRVGELTRNVDPHEYVPQFVSIGPYHRTGNLVRGADKVSYLHAVLSAAAAYSGAPLDLEVYLTEMALLEGRVRSCYAQSVDIPSREFVRMLLLDACYILVRFGDVLGRRPEPPAATAANGLAQAGNRVVPSEEKRKAAVVDQREAVAVVRDVFYLAENQIPFFVVDKIHQLTFLDSKTPALEAIARYAHDLLRWTEYTVATPTVVAPPALRPEPANLLHLLHMHFTPTVLSSVKGSRGVFGGGRPVGRWRTATECYFAGVKFKRRALSTNGGGARSILDVKVSRGGGTLQVPRLNIDAETWRLLRNLMALEQSNPSGAGSHVTAYCVFMSQLACTARDVELLSRRGVIVHGLGNHGEVADLFANLCKGAVFDFDDAYQNYLRPACQTLERRFRSRPRRWMAWLKQKYFINPWLAAGLAAAAIGLVCTVIQAVYSVLSYSQPGN